MPYITVKDLAFKYGTETVLTNISFDIYAGDFVILTGENGAAKSTLLRNILGLLKPTHGTVAIAKLNNQKKLLTIGYVPQQVASFNVGFPSTVYELVQSGRFQNGRWFKRLNQEDKKHIKSALLAVGMWDMRHKKIGDLSGGQKQRISIARTFATDADVYILDEPTTGMDKASREAFYQLLKHSCTHHTKAVLMVTHDYHDLQRYATRHITLTRKEGTPWRCFSMDSCKELS